MNARRWKVFLIARGVLAMAVGLALLYSPTAQAATHKRKPVASALAGTVSSTGACSTSEAGTPTEGDRKLGTEITWMTSPDAAWRAAVDQDKLVFMIQVSGNFARQEFT
jgi:hypothetical protein